ncbi:MAG TPA: S-ribosylhomocysteine lyase [Candidatus Coproplasma excrementavium]|nr:S-ribosylhomocysteine lyase [Candidatus Coproplasma excrementavium]
MERIPSFSKNHDTLQPGLHRCGESHGVTTWDLRFKKPNEGDYIEQKALHTIEHICATILRNGNRKDGIIYFGPMGCRTGFYLLTYGIPDGEIKPMLEDCFRQALTFTEIPGSKREECGNYLEHDLDGAKAECKKYLAVLESI